MCLRFISALALCSCVLTNPVFAGDRLLVLPRFVEDIFHVAQVEPSDINTARGYAGRVEPPLDKSLTTNLHTVSRTFDPESLPTCSDFSFKSWNDWHAQGVKNGEISAFGYWNTPVHFLWRRGRNSIEGVIAIPVDVVFSRVIYDGKITPQIKDSLLNMRGGYQANMLNWIEDKYIEHSVWADCDAFTMYRIKID